MARKPQASINVRLNERPAVAGLRRLDASFAKFATTASSVAGSTVKLGAALAGAAVGIAALSVRSLVAADSVGKLGLRVGVAASEIEALQFAAEQSGSSASDMEKALTALGRRAAATPKLFEKWQVSTRGVNGELLPTRQILDRIADRIAAATNQAERLAIAQDLLSQAGRKLVPALQGGAAGLAELTSQARELGLTIDDFEAGAAAALGDRFNILSRQSTSLSRVFGSVFAPVTAAVSEALGRVAARTVAWTRSNRQFLQSGIISALEFIANNALPAIATGVGAVAKVWTGWRQIVLLFRYTIAQFSQDVNDAFSTLLGSMSRALRFLGADGLAGSLETAAAASASVSDSFSRDMAAYSAAILKADEDQKRLEKTLGDLSVRGSEVFHGLTRDAARFSKEFGEAQESLPGEGVATPTGGGGQGRTIQPSATLRSFRVVGQLASEVAQDTASKFADSWQSASSVVANSLQGVGSAIGALGGNAAGAVAAQKAFAVAAIAINTAVAVSRAFAELGPIGGGIAAAGLVASGAAAVANVLATQPGTTNALRGGGGAIRTGGGARTAGGGPTFAESAPAATVVNVNFNAPQGNPRRTAREINRLAFAGG